MLASCRTTRRRVSYVKRWQPYVLTETGVDRHFYELAVLTELKNGLRAGDVWVPGSRQFKNFEEYLLGRERFAELRDTQALPVAIEVDSERYLQRRLSRNWRHKTLNANKL